MTHAACVCRHERGLLQVVLKATTLGQMMIQMIGLTDDDGSDGSDDDTDNETDDDVDLFLSYTIYNHSSIYSFTWRLIIINR